MTASLHDIATSWRTRKSAVAVTLSRWDIRAMATMGSIAQDAAQRRGARVTADGDPCHCRRARVTADGARVIADGARVIADRARCHSDGRPAASR